ncbi:MAG: pantetheine-phosphate adenylyltransferase [Flavobacteriales bacterium]|nr:pantetheine-phosphate adenylyltransferase [Flavobacteriales bacterium]
MSRIAVFPGSFDPITNGHFDIIERAVPLFDKIIVAIGFNSEKKYMFSLEKRIEFLQESLKQFKNIEIKKFDGLTVDFCKKENANFLLRGLRNPADFEFEKSIAQINRLMTNGKLETVFLLTSAEKSYISSSIVREIMSYNGDYKKMVPDAVRI